jgi:hypothetical protein
MTIILLAKDKILIAMDTCNYKPCSCLGQGAKKKKSQKTSRGMYNHMYSRISLVNARIFHPLTSHRIMRLQIRLHKILGTIFKIIKFKSFNSQLLSTF